MRESFFYNLNANLLSKVLVRVKYRKFVTHRTIDMGKFPDDPKISSVVILGIVVFNDFNNIPIISKSNSFS